MKQKHLTIFICVMLLLTISIGLMHGGKINSRELRQRNSDALKIKLAPQDAQDYIKALLLSRNPVTAAQIFERMPPLLLYQLIERILDEESIIRPQEKIEFLLGAANVYLKNKKVTQRFFELLDAYKQKNPFIAPLLIAAKSSFTEVIPSLAQWLQEEKKLTEWIKHASLEAVKEDDVQVLETLYALHVRPQPDHASLLLAQVVKGNKSPLFLPLLIRRLKANPNHAIDKKTLLMLAAENENSSLVKGLLEHEADPTIILDPAVGSASQIAFEHDFVPIQLLIDSYGKPKRRRR